MSVLIENLSILTESIIWAFVLLGIFWAANHTWLEDDKLKGLVLYPLKQWIAEQANELDKLNIAGFIWNLSILTFGATFPLWGLCMALSTLNPDYLYYGFWGLSLLMFQKSFKDAFVFILGCNRCMPTFWIAIPNLVYYTALSNYYGNPAYLANFTRVLIVTCIVSALTTLVGLVYNKLNN